MVSLADVQNAARLIQGKVLRTPLVYSPTFSRMTGCQIYLKLENLQMGGSFKARGATFKIQSHLELIRDRGVIAASIGNHAQGVALAAGAAGTPAAIVMPVWASIAKQEATRGYGAKVILKGGSLVECIEIARQIASETGKMFIHPYDDEEIIAGQGTIGLEILEDLPDVDTIIVPVGGGGLIGGIATAIKALRPQTRIIGVQTAACPSALEAMKSGRPVALDVVEMGSLADAIMVTQVGDADFPLLRDLVDEIVVVDESQIASAVLLLLERKKIQAEGAGAVPLAALLSESVRLPPGSNVVLVISGGNVDSLLLDRIIHHGLLFQGRLMRFSVLLEDTPGSLAKLLHLIAEFGANVVHIHHARNQRDLPLNFTRVDLELETRGPNHIKEVAEILGASGYRIMGL
jgi:threonine dehydratase